MSLTIGIDIHRDSLTVAQLDGPVWTVDQTAPELTRLMLRLHALRPSVVVLEPSGGYEQALLTLLHQHELPVALVHTHRVRQYIHGLGIQAKSDPLDARMLALYGAQASPRLMSAPSETQRCVAELNAWRRTLRADIVAKTQQLGHQSAALGVSTRRVIAALQSELDTITAEIAALVTAAPAWTRTRQILRSCPGVGPQSVAVILAELPELGQGDAKPLAALVGVAPFTHQSGTTKGRARIAGGRRQVRSALWMAARTAMRHNPVIAAFAQRLRARHKHEKTVTVACLRKLLTILNAMVRRDQPWNPEPHHA